MKQFMDRDFLLESETAKELYHNYAAALPLVDYHCHISPREIYEDRRFGDLAQVWLGGKTPDGSYAGDHYKWRMMRANGISEDYVTGSADGYQRIRKFAQALEMAIGNPMYHWCNLELRQFFDYEGYLSEKSAGAVWEHCNQKLQNDPTLTVRGMIKRANVVFIGTTDDPVDSLEWHEKLAADPTFTCTVSPSFRPDRAINLTKPGFAAYIEALARSVGKESLTSAKEVRDALLCRLDYFHQRGCKISDHGLDYVAYRSATDAQIEAAFQKAMAGESLTTEEVEGYQTTVLVTLGRAYHRLGMVMQLHYSCLRNANHQRFLEQGPDTGYDMIATTDSAGGIAALLSALNDTDELPKVILYSLNPSDNQQLDTVIGCFQSDELPGKIQHGSAWWFNDTKSGMEEQMKSLANLGLLGNFVGMLTDSRSFLSYARHDYFRRILCNLVGSWVENGEYPNDTDALRRIIEGVCYKNAVRYFGL